MRKPDSVEFGGSGRAPEYTRKGDIFSYGSLAGYLITHEFAFFKERWNITKPARVVCIDDGIHINNQNEGIIPFSGSGAGESASVMNKILAGAEKIKAHRLCGKAGLVLGAERAALGKPAPTQEEIDLFASAEAARMAAILGIPLGRVIGVNDERLTSLRRPEERHVAPGAVIGLSGRFLHNLIGPTLELELPMYFRIAGHYVDGDDSDLANKAAEEALLANQIASGHHGIGIVPQGFTYTALIDAEDRSWNKKLRCLDLLWMHLQNAGELYRRQGKPLNDIHLMKLAYQKSITGNDCQVNFWQIS